MHSSVVTKKGRVAKVVRCELCGQCYAYELERTVRGSANTLFGGGETVAARRSEEYLRRSLAFGIDVVPCPACGWYQSSMIPKARKLHRRWMVYAGQCMMIGLVPAGIVGAFINGLLEVRGGPSLPWPTFVGVLFVLGGLGIGMFIGRSVLASWYDPNGQDVEASKQYAQSRSVLLREEEVTGQGPSREWEF